MKNKKIGDAIIIYAFVIIICFSWFWWILLEKYCDSENYENRELAPLPKFTVDNYDKYSKEFESYFNDNLPFRNNLITINSAIDYFCFERPANENVIIGKNDWLFYNREDDGDPIANYQGNDLLSEDELEAFAANCVNIDKSLKAQGKEFIIFIAPNKERVYSEYMPEQYGKPAEMYRALQIVQYLQENTDIRVVYPYKELMEAKSKLSSNIYYKTDTHWNLIGGYIGASALLKELGINMPDITSDKIKIITEGERPGDLSSMLNLNNFLKKKDPLYKVVGYDTHNMETIENDFYNVISCHAKNADPRKIYIWRDSFASNMVQYIGSQFNDSYLRHRNTYTYDDFVQQDPDIFVYETVERKIDLFYSEVMESSKYIKN